MSKIQSYWLGLSYRKQLFLLILLGGFMAMALPPLFIVPALIPGLVCLFWSLESASTLKRGFFYGWALGFGYFVAGLYWLGHAIAVDLATFWWAMPFALFGLQSCLAIFIGLVSLATVWVRKNFNFTGWPLVLVFAAAWLGADLLRSVIFTGFPWNLLGTTLAGHPILMQFASIGGVHLLSVLVVVWAVTPALTTQRVSRLSAAFLFVLLPVFVVGFGTYRLATLGSDASEFQPNVQLRLVQANIAQSLKWDPDLARANLQKHVELSVLPASNGVNPNLIIWPETAVPYALNRSVEGQQALTSAIFGTGQDGEASTLITGANRLEGKGASIQAWNHLYVLDQSGARVAGYDKHHLVPFGEYMPFRSVLDFAKLTQGNVDFSAGAGPQTLSPANVPSFSPMICYEGIFSANVVDPNASISDRPKWLLSITNDGWFGISSGPHQHLAATVLRSVEEGLPLVRVSNPGVSIVTNALGQTLARTNLGEEGIVDSGLPVPLAMPPFYAIYGLKTSFLLLFMLLLFALISKLINQKKY